MQFSLVLAAVAYAAGTNAAISFGHQYRNGNTNYHVAWTEGTSPCTNDVVIDLDNGNPCGKDFNIDGVTYQLSGCGGPISIIRSDGSLYGTCVSANNQKISCSGSVHDVIKEYVCGP